MSPLEPRSAFVMPGKNGIETSLAILDVISRFSFAKGRTTMQADKVKEILRRLNEAGIPYALIGGLAYSQYAPPRATEDMDLIVLLQDAQKVRQLFPGCYQRGTAIAEVYDLEGTRFDVQPARRRSQVAVLNEALDGTIEGEPVKVASLRNLLFLKLWASVERRERGKRMLDLADITNLLEYNPEKVPAADIAYIAQNVLGLGYTPEESAKYRKAVEWLNDTLDDLSMSDRKFTAPP